MPQDKNRIYTKIQLSLLVSPCTIFPCTCPSAVYSCNVHRKRVTSISFQPDFAKLVSLRTARCLNIRIKNIIPRLNGTGRRIFHCCRFISFYLISVAFNSSSLVRHSTKGNNPLPLLVY